MAIVRRGPPRRDRPAAGLADAGVGENDAWAANGEPSGGEWAGVLPADRTNPWGLLI